MIKCEHGEMYITGEDATIATDLACIIRCVRSISEDIAILGIAEGLKTPLEQLKNEVKNTK